MLWNWVNPLHVSTAATAVCHAIVTVLHRFFSETYIFKVILHWLWHFVTKLRHENENSFNIKTLYGMKRPMCYRRYRFWVDSQRKNAKLARCYAKLSRGLSLPKSLHDYVALKGRMRIFRFGNDLLAIVLPLGEMLSYRRINVDHLAYECNE